MALLVWVYLLAFCGLFVEILLVRIFDTVVGANASYTIVTLAVLGGGIAGLTATVRPDWPARITSPDGRARLSLAVALAVLLLYPALQSLPFSVDLLTTEPIRQSLSLLVLFIAVGLPFFLIGLGVASALTEAPVRAPAIYGADLLGAALGAVLVSPLLPHLGPVGALVFAAGLSTMAAAWSRPRPRPRAALNFALAGALVISSSAGLFRDLDVDSHAHKRGSRETRLRAEAEFRRWDPVSKIEVVDVTERAADTGLVIPGSARKLISYDGGSQSSHIYPFDGDLAGLRRSMPASVVEHFWQRGVLAGHYLLRDHSARTLVIGCAGGQEVKAALLYGAERVDALDVVSTVIDLGIDRYAEYNGRLFLDPRVHYFQAEARAYLATDPEPYDLIQIFSYHNSARLAAGGGAVKAYYLQTTEALQLFLGHLSERGLLQINQAFYPRVLVTLGEAMTRLAWPDPTLHVVVYCRDGLEDHATILVRRQPWTAETLCDLDALLLADLPQEGRRYRRVVDPLSPAHSFIPPAIWAEGTTSASRALRNRAPYRLDPVTDDRPFAFFLRKNLGRVVPDSNRFVDESIATLLDQPFSRGWMIPRDVAHLVVTGGAVLLLAGLALWLPLRWAPVGRAFWPERGWAISYFSFLGAGFLILELTLLQLGLRAVGMPIHAYATTLGTLLVAAGLGSLTTRWVASSRGRAGMAWLVLLGTGVVFIWLYPQIWNRLAGASLEVRIAGVAAALAPLGFALGVPFPLGIHALRLAPPGSVAWAWAANAIATVVGGIASAVLALLFGLQTTLWIGVGLYAGAALVYLRWSSRLASFREHEPDRPLVATATGRATSQVRRGIR